MKVIELFSGIGSQAKALSRISEKRNINVEVLKTCEWNIHALIAYNYIHNSTTLSKEVLSYSKEELINILKDYSLSYNGANPITLKQLKTFDIKMLQEIYQSIKSNNNMINIKEVKGTDIPSNLDLLTYSFPCQDLSNVGSFHGYKHGIDRGMDTRSGLLWEVERILEEMEQENLVLPRFLLLENVTALVAQRHNGNFEEWKSKLESFGYLNTVYKLNAQDFGIPQYRKRLIMLSVYVGDDLHLKEQLGKYFKENDLNDSNYLESLSLVKKPLKEYLKLDYNIEKFKKEALEAQPNDTPSRVKIWNRNAKIVDKNNVIAEKVQTITTKQDRHPNSGNIYFDMNNNKSKYRFLTPRECFLLMGFDESDFEILISNNLPTRKNTVLFSRDTLYKLAGNSIVVNVLESVFNQIIDIRENYLHIPNNNQ